MFFFFFFSLEGFACMTWLALKKTRLWFINGKDSTNQFLVEARTDGKGIPQPCHMPANIVWNLSWDQMLDFCSIVQPDKQFSFGLVTGTKRKMTYNNIFDYAFQLFEWYKYEFSCVLLFFSQECFTCVKIANVRRTKKNIEIYRMNTIWIYI